MMGVVGGRWRGSSFLMAALLTGACAPPEEPVSLVVLATTDVHGWLLGWDYEVDEPAPRGLSLLLPLVDSIRAENPGRTLLLDGGDLLQGNALAAEHARAEWAPAHPVIAAMNAAGYDAAALGNHEFNFGLPFLEAAIEGAEFPFLSANLALSGGGGPAFPRFVLIEREVEGRPLRIGVTAVTPPGILVWDRDHLAGRIEARPIVESLAEVVPAMREAGADVVIISGHSGLEGSSYDTVATGLSAENAMAEVARTIPGIDLILLAHTHRAVADTVVNGVLLIQPGNFAASLGVATLGLEARREGGWRVVSRRGALLAPDPQRSDPRLDARVADAHARTRTTFLREVATTPDAWSAAEARVRDTAIIDLIQEVQRKVSGAQLSAAASFGVRAAFGPGPISVAQVARLYPYDNNTLRVVRIDGGILRAYLEKSAEYFLPCPNGECERLIDPSVPGYNFDILSGVDYTLDLTRPRGDRVVRLEYEGRAVSEQDVFTLALNNYRQGGGGGFPGVATAPVVYEGDESIRTLILRELETRGTIRANEVYRPNWEIIPARLAEQALREIAAGGR